MATLWITLSKENFGKYRGMYVQPILVILIPSIFVFISADELPHAHEVDAEVPSFS